MCINFCPKSRSNSFSFSCLQQSTHHHPSCYLHQFLLIKLQTSVIIMFINFSMELEEKYKKNSKLVFEPHIEYILKSFQLLGESAGFLCPLKKDPPETVKIKPWYVFIWLNILCLIACYRRPLKFLGSNFHSMWWKWR